MHYSNNTLAVNAYLNNKYASYNDLHNVSFYPMEHSVYKAQTVLHFLFTNIACMTIIYILDCLLKKVT